MVTPLAVLGRRPMQLLRVGPRKSVREGVVRRVGQYPKEKEAKEGHAKGPGGQQFQKSASVPREYHTASEREEEGAESKGSQGESCRRTPVVGPIQRRCLDRRGEGHAASESGQEREDAHHTDGSSSFLVGSRQGNVAQSKQQRAHNDPGPGAAIVNEEADRDSQGVHSQIPRQPYQVTLRGCKVQLVGELRRPGRVDVLRQANVSSLLAPTVLKQRSKRPTFVPHASDMSVAATLDIKRARCIFRSNIVSAGVGDFESRANEGGVSLLGHAGGMAGAQLPQKISNSARDEDGTIKVREAS
jgi:hypothetical protein